MPDAPATAAPPAAAPAPPPAAPAKAPPSADPPEKTESYADAFSELEAIDKADNRGERTAPRRGPTGRWEKPETKPPAKAETSAETEVKEPKEGAGDKPPAAVTPPGEAPKPVKAAELRTAYENVKTKNKELESKVTELEGKVKEYANRTPEDTKPLQDRLASAEKERDELREEIRFVNYSKHPEFQDKYQKPYEAAWHKALGEIGQLSLKTVDADGVEGTRKATHNDLLALANAPLDQLDTLAEDWFGRSAARVVRHVEKLRDLAEAQENALAEARKGSTEREKQQKQRLVDWQKQVAETYTKVNTDLKAKYPKWFAPEDGDTEGNGLLEKGFAYVDAALSANGQLTEAQKAERLAVIRNKAANHDRMALRLKRASARVAELEASLAEFEGSEPAGGAAGERGQPSKGFIEDANAEIEALDKKHRV